MSYRRLSGAMLTKVRVEHRPECEPNKGAFLAALSARFSNGVKLSTILANLMIFDA
jgi:hypothetical protein